MEWRSSWTAVSADDPHVRLSHAERDAVASNLAEHFAEGRLSLEEYEERVEAVLRSKTREDLDPLLVDLPAGRIEAVPVRRARRRRPLVRVGQGRPAARLVAIGTVLAVAAATGPAALLLLWPAFALTGRPEDRGEATPLVRVATAPAVRVMAGVAVVAFATIVGPVGLLLLWPVVAVTRPPQDGAAPAAIQLHPGAET